MLMVVYSIGEPRILQTLILVRLLPKNPYFYIMETPDNQWDQKWKLNDEFDGAADGHNPGAITKISVIFNVENYTHKVELAN